MQILGQEITTFDLPKKSFLSLRRVAGAAGLTGLEMRHGFQKSLIVLLAPHKDRSKQNQRCNHATWSFVDFCAIFPWLLSAGLALPIFSGAFLPRDRNTVA